MLQTYIDCSDNGPFPQRRIFRQLKVFGHDAEDAVQRQPLSEQVSPRILEHGPRKMTWLSSGVENRTLPDNVTTLKVIFCWSMALNTTIPMSLDHCSYGEEANQSGRDYKTLRHWNKTKLLRCWIPPKLTHNQKINWFHLQIVIFYSPLVMNVTKF